jgi:hypothetical protein
MKGLITTALVLTLVGSAAMAADATAPLTAGKPAGVKQAQAISNTVWIVGAVAVAGVGIGLAVSGGGGGNNAGTTTPVTTGTAG